MVMMTKSHTTLTIDGGVLAAAKARGMNISALLEETLRRYLSMDDIEKRKDEASPALQKAMELMTPEEKAECERCIQREARFAAGWKRRIKNTVGVDVDENELLRFFGKH